MMMRASHERGETLVEFAVSMALFFMVVFGLLELGIGVFRYNIISDLAQEGARRAAVCGTQRNASLNCNITTFVQGRALGMTVTVTTTPADVTTLVSGQTVQVQVQHTFARMTRIVPMLSSWTISATSQMIVAR